MGRFIGAFLVLIALGSCGNKQSSDLNTTDKTQIEHNADTAIVPFTIDLSDTKFKFNSQVAGVFYYTVDGLGDAGNDTTANAFYVMPTSQPTNCLEDLKIISQSFIASNKANGMVIPAIEEKETRINGKQALEISFICTYKNRHFKAYQVIISDSTGVLLFGGSAASNYDEILKEFKAIVQTIKIK